MTPPPPHTGELDLPGPSHHAPPVEDPLDRSRFPVDEWRLVETRFCADDLGTTESLFSIGNGYLGMRGNYSESRDAHVDGTYLNGFHETWPIFHAEEAYGFARVGQTIVNAPDPKIIRLYVDDEPLHLSLAELLGYERALDFRDGVLTRDLIWRTPGGKRVHVKTTRMVPLEQRHLAIITYEVMLLDYDASLAISSQLINRQDEQREPSNGEAGPEPDGDQADPRKAEAFNRRVLMPRLHAAEPENGSDHARLKLGYRTARSGMTIGVVADHRLETAAPYSMTTHSDDDSAKVIYRISGQAGVPVKLTKVVAFHTADTVPPPELIDRCERTLDRTWDEGIDQQFAGQRAWLDEFWRRSDVEVPGHPALQQAIRWNLFSILQASARAEGQGIAAKGVSGSGYGGHYFWDTEVYVMPFLTYTMPWAARNALGFRSRLLDSARARARELAQKGALFPWRTINGHEASAYYAAGTAQYHIDADVAYALSQYVGATGDDEFLSREAIDIFVETARLWADLGFWRDESRRTFHIHGVTGPDEYTTVVNDNLYTNVLARFNLRRAARAVWELQRDDPAAYDEMVRRTGLTEDEPEEWAACAAGMLIPYDEHLGIHPQDINFLEREMWDLERTPLDKRPLLLNYHPLVIYRFQVLKQADVVLALFLQGEEFTAEQKKADFDYYDPITTGDSTLSAVMQSIMAAEVGYHELALRYFVSALFVDLADRHHNTADGVHVASTGGVWSALVGGFGGFRDLGTGAGDQQFSIDPRLPESWESLVYRLTLRGTRVRVTLTADEVAFEVEYGDGPVTFDVRGETVVVAAGRPASVELKHQGPRLTGEPPYPAGIQRADGTVISAIVPSGD